jgi:hypothetical protein
MIPELRVLSMTGRRDGWRGSGGDGRGEGAETIKRI